MCKFYRDLEKTNSSSDFLNPHLEISKKAVCCCRSTGAVGTSKHAVRITIFNVVLFQIYTRQRAGTVKHNNQHRKTYQTYTNMHVLCSYNDWIRIQFHLK